MKNKINKNINDQDYFDKFLKSIPEQTKRSARISLDIASQINAILKKKNISQRELAFRLDKKESEISKWLSGNHNFTIKTLAGIETILGEDIVTVPILAEKIGTIRKNAVDRFCSKPFNLSNSE
jgi:ribosome-binding protein aMBF1 (putative translation factor)